MLDNTFDTERPWVLCDPDRVWCKGTKWHINDRLIASILAPANRNYYAGTLGLVLSPAFNTLLCSYVQDGGSDFRRCWPEGTRNGAGCIPGCSGKGTNVGNHWCRPPPWRDPDCSWAPKDLHSALEQSYQPTRGYNELVFDLEAYIEHLPRSVEAFFYAADPRDVRADQVELVRATHARFLDHFGASFDALPLLAMARAQQEEGEGPLLKLLDEGMSCRAGECTAG